jgi:hypothetical protein
MPATQPPSPDSDNGRGLLLVQALAAQWGTYRQPTGKVVWVRLTT